MNPFVLVDGIWTVTGGCVVVDLVQHNKRGRASSSVLLSDGRTVELVYDYGKSDGRTFLVTEQGRHYFRLSGADFVRFTVDGVPFEINADDITRFTPVR